MSTGQKGKMVSFSRKNGLKNRAEKYRIFAKMKFMQKNSPGNDFAWKSLLDCLRLKVFRIGRSFGKVGRFVGALFDFSGMDLQNKGKYRFATVRKYEKSKKSGRFQGPQYGGVCPKKEGVRLVLALKLPECKNFQNKKEQSIDRLAS